jgi:hypothetical protein
MTERRFKTGDVIAYRLKDLHGIQTIVGKVTHYLIEDMSHWVGLQTIPDRTHVAIPQDVPVLVPTVWQATMKPAEDDHDKEEARMRVKLLTTLYLDKNGKQANSNNIRLIVPKGMTGNVTGGNYAIEQSFLVTWSHGLDAYTGQTTRAIECAVNPDDFEVIGE